MNGMQSCGSGFFSFIYISVLVLVVIALWRVFEKAGQPGWAAIVPFYNLYILCKIAGKPGWWVLLMLIPLVNIVILLLVKIDLARAFGKDTAFAIGLWLLPIVFYPLLAFGDAQYRKPAPAAAIIQS